ncbi:MAG: hypothetical protein MUC87_14095 [Bacteroidia bacterium]|jgi:hypothetical protein|nr:hypothetical protein [Bacteroidia bacterium]
MRNPLWNAIQEFETDNPGSPLSFTHRLARENGWTMQYSIRAVDEYKKFIYLICVAPHPLTPSDQVDQVWHLHMIYTQSYWKDFCERTLKREIHHGPTKGGKEEAEKFNDWYARTLEMYRAVFLYERPSDIWPHPAKRFSDVHFKRINTRINWVIPKPRLLVQFLQFIHSKIRKMKM